MYPARKFVRRDLFVAVLAEEPAQLIRILELGHVAVEEDAVQAFVPSSIT